MTHLTLSSLWGCYELDGDSWSDETAHVLRRIHPDGSGETWVVHCDPEGEGISAEAYADKQSGHLAGNLPEFVLLRGGPRHTSGGAGHELAFSWVSPRGPVEQVQVYVPGSGGMLVFTASGFPRLSPMVNAALARALATLRASPARREG